MSSNATSVFVGARPGGRFHVVFIAAALICALPHVAGASRDIHYGAVDHPELLACDRTHWRGENDASSDCYRGLLRSATPAEVRAEAAWALKDLHAANEWFREAVRERPDDAAIRVRWGDLFASSHNGAEAMNLYREAMLADASNAFARLGAARVLVGRFDDAANTYLEPLLTDGTVAPGAQIGAWLLLTQVALENGNREDARHALDRAEELVTSHDWPPLHVYALRAASDLLDGITHSRFTEMSLAYNPRYGGIFAVPAHFYVITRRYRDAIDLYQRAIETEPGLASAHEELGVNLLRDNQVSRARQHLEDAHSADPFSPKAVNTLRLLDSFADFDLINDPATPGDRDDVPIVLRLHHDEAHVISPYAIDLVRRSIDEFTARYEFELREPVIIEMYPDHEDFAVRTAGMPGIGILGATFGYVVAMDSPSSRPATQFQWGTTLWHEMAHVFTLEATEHLVPRWFSEGVSVFEEWQSGPSPGVRIPIPVLVAMQQDRFLPIADLDEGFLRPTYEEQVIVSYMQAGLICRFIEQRYGAGRLSAMLDSFAGGLGTREAVQASLGVSPAQFDREFAAHVEEEFGQIVDNLDTWHEVQTRMLRAAEAADWEAASEAANAMLEIMPGYVEPDSPYLVLARAQQESTDPEAALETLEEFWRRGGFEPDALKQLASWLNDKGREDDAIEVLREVILVQPLDLDVHGTLGDLLLETGDADGALREYRVALAMDPHDKASAYYRIAQAHHARGKIDESRQHLLLALDVAPGYRPAQRLLLELERSEQD